MINKLGQKVGPKRGNYRRFPYEPRVVGGKHECLPNCRRFIDTWLKRLSSKKSLRK